MKAVHLLPLLFAGLCSLGHAQSEPRGERPPGDGPRGIARFDANGDGVLVKEELKDNPRLLERFDELDTNKDGKLTEDEMRAGMRPRDGQGPRN